MSNKQNFIWKNDRNFALDEYEKQQYYYVAESNDLITKARHDLDARELKIMDYVVSKIKATDENLQYYPNFNVRANKCIEFKKKW